MRALVPLALALFVAGCGDDQTPACGIMCPGADLGACGGADEPCCHGTICDVGYECDSNLCRLVSCGAQGELCCNGGCNDLSLLCVDNLCILECGQRNQGCCPGGQCSDPNTVCRQGLCQPPLAPTGTACLDVSECDGAGANCITKDSAGIVYPGGYCTSKCDPTQNKPDGINVACPGGSGVCVGLCYASCTAKNGSMPCSRQGYSCFTFCAEKACFGACYPTSASECAPSVPGSCGPGMACYPIGLDDVGQCLATCDLFKQDCNQAMGSMGCYIQDDTGQGYCSQVGDLTDGAPCQYINDCLPGLGCFQNGNTGVCRPFCGGPMNVPCTNGKSCVDFSTKVKVAVAGVCAG
jgi:hypothetical protein